MDVGEIRVPGGRTVVQWEGPAWKYLSSIHCKNAIALGRFAVLELFYIRKVSKCRHNPIRYNKGLQLAFMRPEIK